MQREGKVNVKVEDGKTESYDVEIRRLLEKQPLNPLTRLKVVPARKAASTEGACGDQGQEALVPVGFVAQ